ncbi:NAD/NADP-dependent octopine/nopaline dehydrogenase family protein [Aurantimonas sp. VKM B-3413]|uniref:NAD/NADP octopine/nopaline dehydrogenase family protein n=1 Tax=Aurantimonas sp. VKM B-3413 TaxID=2779401 RepID=UPI001E54762C|nr:NAD/NADP-dependent octopine/nopaline dehydrogenase family protein [Aurantimonas sp. VKM B-3413]MCB8840308.1 NAD/NADP octopine/nopaline dehydrogenase family protein [Aurantimonas sp. VKM B-3413]
MKIAVLGGGNGSHAAAADLSEAGHAVRFWRRDGAAFGPMIETRTIALRDFKGLRDVSIPVVTDDLAEAVRGAELIVAPVPAFAQEDLARRLAPHLSDGQVIYLPPGTFGSYLMTKILRDAGSTADVAIAETGTLPWLTRKHGPGEIAITTRATRLPTGVFPARHSNHALAVISQAFPDAIEPVEDALSGALMNAGPIIHPPLILMNAGPIEHFDRWDIHNEGTQASIRRVHSALDAERIAVREALGYGAPHFPLADHYETSNWMYGNLAHDKLVGSGDWHEHLDLKAHRYMLEDVACGLALLVSIGEWAGVPVPVAAGLLAIAGAATGNDFRRSGRTLEGLGLSETSRAEMQALLRDGL